jgi:hypothetical protein
MPWTNVRTALDLLQVDRIDHGYTVVDAPDFARECAERGVLFTVVPTNSYYLRTCRPSAGRSTTRSGACPAWACASIPTPTTRRCTRSHPRRPG